MGIGTYTYGWAIGVPGNRPAGAMDEQGLLDAARALGVRLVQIGDNLPLHEFPADRLDRLAARARREGVALQLGARGLTPTRLAAYLSLAARLDAALIRFVPDDGDYRPDPDTLTGVLRDALPGLGGVTVALENHDRFSARALGGILDAVDDPRVGLCLDTANSLGAGEGLDAVLDRLAPHVVHLHLKDYAIERLPYLMGFTVSGRALGGGRLDVPALLTRLAPYGRCHSAVLELWTPPEDRLEETIAKEAAWVEDSLKYWRGLVPAALEEL